MLAWDEFEREEPEMAQAGRRCLVGDDGIAIGFLATVSREGRSNLAPVCPVFCGGHVFVIAASHTPKTADLAQNGEYTLHALLGEGDEEFQFGGRAQLVEDPLERSDVHEAVPFGSFGRNDPIFRLELARAVWAYWERPGQPATKQVKKSWRARLTRD